MADPENKDDESPSEQSPRNDETKERESSSRTPASEAEDKEAFFDPKKVPPELKGVYDQMRKQHSKKNQEMSAKIKAADLMNQVLTDPSFAMEVAKKVAAHHGRTDLMGSQGKAEGTEDEIPDEVLQDKAKFKKYLDERDENRAKSVRESLLSENRKLQLQIQKLQMEFSKDKYPLSAEFETEIEEAMSNYNIPYEKAYNMVTAEAREELAARRAKEERRQDAEDAEGDETFGAGLPAGVAEGLVLKKGHMSLAEIDKALASKGSR